MTHSRNERRDELTVPATNGGHLSGGPRATGAVWVNAGYGQGIAVTVSPDAAEAFGRWLIESARLARTARNA